MLRIALVGGALALSGQVLAIEGLPPGIGGKMLGHGWQFADASGKTLYTFDRDEGAPGTSTCNGECVVTWPPMLAPADAKPAGDWSTITREDGAAQWAYKGMPLYRYASDAFEYATFGDGVNGAWRTAFQPIATPGEIKITQTILGQVLADAKGLTLYAQEGDKASCDTKCLQTWQPIAAPWLGNAFDDFSVVARENGFRQWAFKGKPLYRNIADVGPGEISGHTAKGWKSVVLEPAAPLPPWATVQSSDAGQLIANEQGLTVYAHEFNPRNRRAVLGRPANCVGECVDPQWIPFIAATDAKPMGSWALVDLPDGKKQWSYKGNKIYTNVADQKPGDFKGIRFGGDRSWAAIMRNGQPMQGVTVGG
jgi:predicted lipoprotein with Yx(FWY)xxD motif